MTTTFVNLTGTSEPFHLDVGQHVLVVSGVFNNAAVTLQRREPNYHPDTGDTVTRGLEPPISLWHAVGDAITEPGTSEFTVEPAGVGFYRLRIDIAGNAPSIAAVIDPQTSEPAASAKAAA